MSSHHIVKDYQEPALAVVSDVFSREVLSQLLEWSPVVCVTEEALPAILELGVKADILFYTDSALADQLLSAQAPVELIRRDGSDLKDLLSLLSARGQHALNFIGMNDPESFAELALSHRNFKMVCYSGATRIFPVFSTYSRWYKEGAVLRILSPEPSGMSIEGSFRRDSSGRVLCTAAGLLVIKTPAPILLEEDL
jgi:thiamine pyrophosphokinase